MKNNLYLLILFTLLNSAAFSQQKKPEGNFTLKGSITGHRTHIITLRYADANGKKTSHEAHVKNGSFLFRLSISSPVFAELTSDAKRRSENDSYYTEIFLSPGNMTISLKENAFDQAKITGSIMQDDWEMLKKQQAPLFKAEESLEKESNKITAGGNTPNNHAAVVIIGNKIDQYRIQRKQIDYKFILDHPASYLSAFLIENDFEARELRIDSAEMFYNAFRQPVKNSIAGRRIKKILTDRKASGVGSMAPLFVKTDINGKTLSLQSFRNKNHVLLYLWASYCMPGRGESQHLKQLYNKYHPKGLEVIGISFDFEKKTWKDTLTKNGMEIWHNAIDRYDNVRSSYDINGTPPSFLFLIDKKGKIIGRYMGDHVAWEVNGDNEGSMNDLGKKLAETFDR